MIFAGVRAGAAATAAVAALAASLAAAPARAAPVTILPGQEITLTDDVVLATTDNFTAGAAGGARCKIHGAGKQIRTAPDDPANPNPWTGTLTIQACDLDGLGSDMLAAIDVTGTNSVTIQDSTFSNGGLVSVGLSGAMNVLFQRNRMEANNLYPVVSFEPSSSPAFIATGRSTGMKLFQGNLILKGRAHFESTNNWLIGGDTPAESNVLVGLRAGFKVESSDDNIVRGNYTHTMIGAIGWNQVKNMSVIQGSGNLVEHNVFRGFNWLIELTGGAEVRYNLLFDAVERGWVLYQAKAGNKVHHNVLVAVKSGQYEPAGAFVLETDTSGLPDNAEVYNNTVDGNGVCNPGVSEGAVVFHNGGDNMGNTALSVLQSMRSNAFTDMRLDMGTTLVGVYPNEMMTPPPVHLGYSDYNFFYNPDSPVKEIYGVGMSDGFGMHDVPAHVVGGTSTDTMNVKPAFAGPLPHTFPFEDDGTHQYDLANGTTTVCQVLAYYRQIYTPTAGSPLVDHGDPMEGAGNDIGAIGAGAPNALDLFGTLCDPSDTGHPTIASDTYTCSAVNIDPTGGPGPTGIGGSGPPPPTPTGIICVCDVHAGAPQPGAFALMAGAIGLALWRRKARSRNRAPRRDRSR
jgi:hypothetical protein